MACDHRGCRCDEDKVNQEGRHFCSEACANAEIKNRHQSSCPCGHPDCKSS